MGDAGCDGEEELPHGRVVLDMLTTRNLAGRRRHMNVHMAHLRTSGTCGYECAAERREGTEAGGTEGRRNVNQRSMSQSVLSWVAHGAERSARSENSPLVRVVQPSGHERSWVSL